MNQNKLTFQSENLVVDWISFKFKSLENNEQRKIVHYLQKKAIQLNLSKVLFVKKVPYSKGSGSNATRFESLVQKKLVNCKIFSSTTLGRFDLYYSWNNKSTDKISVKDFLENCQRELKQTNKNFSFEKNRKGWILKIGSPRSDNEAIIIFEFMNHKMV